MIKAKGLKALIVLSGTVPMRKRGAPRRAAAAARAERYKGQRRQGPQAGKGRGGNGRGKAVPVASLEPWVGGVGWL